MGWDPAVRAKLKKLRELREQAGLRPENELHHCRRSARRCRQKSRWSSASGITDELGDRARIIYNAKTMDVEPPYDLARAVTPA
jgi:hypothetical protein